MVDKVVILGDLPFFIPVSKKKEPAKMTLQAARFPGRWMY
jgi:hypothetical protein